MKTGETFLGKSGELSVDFSEFVANIPVGVCRYLRDDSYTLDYANPHFYAICGYTPEQVETELGNELRNILLPEEMAAIAKMLEEQARGDNTRFCVEHRVIRRSGEMLWVMASGYLTSCQGQAAAVSVMIDITDRKRMEEQLRIDEERFRLAMSQTDNTIFDYDIATKKMLHAAKSTKRYGLSQVTENVPDCLVENQSIHADSVEAYLEMYNSICNSVPSATCEALVRVESGHFAWQRITMTSIFSREGKTVRAVGLVEDIDEQKRREESLRERSSRDALTGLYNKGVTESRVRELLEQEGSTGTLAVLDIDCFKGVNDNYGHLFGDYVLAESARRIADLCRREDVVGRIGGDEFLIYLNGVASWEVALRKAEGLCSAFEKPFSSNGLSAIVTCTVGLTFYPIDGDSFETLYQKADIALYAAKRQGKNCYCLYDNSMGDSVGWVPYSNTAIDAPVQRD